MPLSVCIEVVAGLMARASWCRGWTLRPFNRAVCPRLQFGDVLGDVPRCMRSRFERLAVSSQ